MNQSGPLRRHKQRRVPRDLAVWLSACLVCASSGSALAGDWSIGARVSQAVDFYQKYGSLSSGNGPYLAFTESAAADFTYRTHESNWLTTVNIVEKQFVGPGADSSKNRLAPPRFSTNYTQFGKRATVSVGASYSFEYIPDLEEFDVLSQTFTPTDAYRHNYSVNGSVSYKIDRRNSVSLSAVGNQIYYDGPGTDSTSLNTNLRWNRTLSQLTSVYIGPGFRIIDQSDSANTTTLIYSMNAGLSTRLTKRLSANLGGGISYIEKSSDDLFGKRKTDLNPGFTLDAGLTYTLKTWKLAAKANYGFDTSELGDLENRGSASLMVSKTINDASSIDVTLKGQVGQSYADSLTGSTFDNVNWGYSISPIYNYTLARDWNLRTGYRFLYLNKKGDGGTSHNVFVSVSHNFTALP